MTLTTRGRTRHGVAARLRPYLTVLSGLHGEPGRIPASALLPLRLFLGVTFIYAGFQKLTDPQFFSPTAPGFIGRQMSGFVRGGSPLSPLLTHLAIPHAAAFGALIAFCELWVGLSALLGLVTRLGACGGLAINLTFYLTATWTVHPYFLGADLPYALAWLTLALAGPGPYSLDASFFGPLLREAPSKATSAPSVPSGTRTRQHAPPVPSDAPDVVARAAVLRGAGTALGVIIAGGLAGVIAKLRTPPTVFAHTAGALATPQPTAGTAARPSAPPGMTYLGNVKVLPVNSAGQYTDPISGDPALLIHLPSGQFVAYDAVCTHAGCTVEYDPTQHDLVCPCHGAVYDPAHGAQVLAGPAPQPLAPLQVRIDAHGNAYAKGGSGGATPPTPAAGEGQ